MDRLGSKNEEITITRLIMKNTVEEDIYNINKNFVS
jgi:SNF2 family DNA or RNA helicase